MREWYEPKKDDTTLFSSIAKWVPVNHGGPFRKWFGNNENVLNWESDGKEIKSLAVEKYNSVTRTVTGMGYYFREGITWGAISSADLSVRYFPSGYCFTNAGMCGFGDEANLRLSACFMNSKVVWSLLKILTPTLNFGPNQISLLPASKADSLLKKTSALFCDLLSLSKSDWDAFETSWDFTTLPLLHPDTRQPTLAASYASLRARWQQMTDEMQRLEEENNRIFIDAYGLQDELDADVPLTKITLTCNPAYRYRGNDDLEGKLCADTMREFLSYAVGCMFGRYSLDAPGLILANQGETLADYLARVPNPTFTPDEDNVIPILNGDWFPDDITERFRLFLRTTFGEAHFRENLRSIEEALGKDIRKYFTKDFYADHVKRYKKRPIYWMFASPKGSFQALIYMHRYREDTVSVVLNDYLRAFTLKLEGHRRAQEALSISPEASQSQRTKAIKEIEKVSKQITELEAWERDVLFPLASRKQAIDLDDGVKVNYPKFGAALKKIVGVS
ncbi:MAG: BREX-1 system adenine-specific DNA-methyltransferase PglX [Bacteroidales bacterium]|nr:BREX-1 system adenine-specific DNA-methyltransferase PglX [Bacteroidales bacterium]